MITREAIAHRLLGYMNHRLTLAELVDWAESSIMEGSAEEAYAPVIMQALGRIGAADVREFGLLWEDCESIMLSLGFNIKVEANIAA